MRVTVIVLAWISFILLTYSQLYGMDNTPPKINAFSDLDVVTEQYFGGQHFKDYFANGNLRGDEEMPRPSDEDFKDMERIINDPCLPYTPWLEDQSENSLEDQRKYATQFNERFAQWRCYSNDFIKCVAYKQQLSTHLAQKSNKEERKKLSDYFKALESQRHYYAQQLTARRKSGEEQLLRYATSGGHSSNDYIRRYTPQLSTEWAFLQSIIDACNTEKPALLTKLNPTSMAIIRHQACEGLKDISYKKTTEYDGYTRSTARYRDVCIIKMPGDHRRHMWFGTLEHLLSLY